MRFGARGIESSYDARWVAQNKATWANAGFGRSRPLFRHQLFQEFPYTVPCWFHFSRSQANRKGEPSRGSPWRGRRRGAWHPHQGKPEEGEDHHGALRAHSLSPWVRTFWVRWVEVLLARIQRKASLTPWARRLAGNPRVSLSGWQPQDPQHQLLGVRAALALLRGLPIGFGGSSELLEAGFG